MNQSVSKPKIVVIINYARSGGTILAKLLQSNPKIILLSEINPIKSAHPDHFSCCSADAIKEQLFRWHGIQIEGNSFIECVQSAVQYCHAENKLLVIRDWSIINFVPLKQNNFSPTNQLEITNELARQNKFDVRYCALIRNAYDVSLSRSESPKCFIEHYRKYINEVIQQKIEYFRFEDLVSNPLAILNNIVQNTDVEITFETHDRFKLNSNVTGDNQSGDRARIISNKLLKPPRRIPAPIKLIKILLSPGFKELNYLFGYNTNFWEANFESPFLFVKRLVRKISKNKINLF